FAASPVIAPPIEESADISRQVHEFCGACHVYPPPDSFPKRHWAAEVLRGFSFAAEAPPHGSPPPVEDVKRYYESRAPLELPPADIHYATTPPPIAFDPMGWDGPSASLRYAIADVSLVHLYDGQRLDILACDFNSGAVLVLRPYESDPSWRVLAELSNPAHASVLDLNHDGIQDILIADLGNMQPTDRLCGRVVWLRGHRDGTFSQHTLLEDVGRVADVQAADFRGTGKLDLVVAEFGLHRAGSIHFLENQTTDWDSPEFVSSVLDSRHGAIHVPTIDLNADGKPDFIALISQEHEAVVAFLNRGDGSFDKQTIFAAQQPGFGSSGIQLIDINSDGHLDVLYSNGDTLDLPALLKPFHEVQWLENP
ncbi:MAG: FG-GAP repeat domain-containing protein, partial [Terriglobales bacterium]